MTDDHPDLATSNSEVPVFETFEAFWPYYLGEHKLISCRILHYIGTVGSFVLLVYLLLSQQWMFLPLVLVAGY